MSINIHTPAAIISASTTSARVAVPQSSSGFIRVVNGSTSLAYINAGGDTVVSTNANIACEPSRAVILEREVLTDTHVSALLLAGTGTISISPVGQSKV